MKVVIIAGGKGTRLGALDLPKPMIQIAGKPILEYQVENVKKYNLKDIYILSGYNAHKIVDYFGDGSKWDVNITHVIEEIPLGTAGALKQIEHLLKEKFLVLYGDTLFDINLSRMIEFNLENESIGTLLVHPNDHPHDSDLVEIDSNFNIIQFHSKPHPENKYFKNLVNAALYILTPEIFGYIPANQTSDFGKDIFPKILSSGGSLKAFKSTEYIKDMGTPERLRKVSSDMISGKISRLNITNKRKAIFLDRDGVINEEKGNIFKLEDFIIIPGIADAIRKINQSLYLVVVVTNQPVLAKGFCTEETLRQIQNKMEYELGQQGAYIDATYFCPHHPDKGYPGEITSLKIDCNCRKPAIGMIAAAKSDLNIDLSGSYIIGDSTTDIQTGLNAGLKSVLLKTGYGGTDGKYSVVPDFTFETLMYAVNFILGDISDEK